MKALYKVRSGGLKVLELDEPFITRVDDVKIRVRYNTICSDETRMNLEEDFFSREGIVGHEMCGEIVDLGIAAKEQGFQIGGKVGGDPSLGCGKCLACKRRKENYCVNLKFLNGSMCKYIIRSSRQLVKLDSTISFKEGCLIEPIAAVLQAIEKADISFGKSLAVFGAGFAGLMFVQIAKMRGARNITVIEPLQYRRELALKRGADYVLDYHEEQLCERLSEISDFNGFDVIVETSAKIEVIDYCIKSVTRGGTILLHTYYGTHEKISFNTMKMYMENISICFSFSSHGKLEEAARILPLLKTEELIMAEFKLDKGLEAYEYEKTKQSIKVAVKI